MKGTGKGTGLGLAMVHGMAEQSGGRLFLKSKKNHGTVAEIWLPAALADQSPAIGPSAAIVPIRGSPPDRSTKRIPAARA
jgi:histidine kinase/DNA gyrase B/HSP90-like ATPase